jgi:hypothetical protein
LPDDVRMSLKSRLRNITSDNKMKVKDLTEDDFLEKMMNYGVNPSEPVKYS